MKSFIITFLRVLKLFKLLNILILMFLYNIFIVIWFNHYFLDRKTKTNPAIGDMVKVLSPSFEGFFRAKIINIVENANLVFYIDFGNTEVVQSNYLFELSDDLNKKVNFNYNSLIT